MLTKKKIAKIGFASVGENVRISEHAQFYGASKIHLGNHVRIDDFCILSAGIDGIEIGDYVHIAVYSSIIGHGRVHLDHYSNISSRVSIYSSNDDYSGFAMTNPMVPSKFTNVKHAPVYIGKHVIIGSGSIILPGVKILEGAAIGALSLIKKDCDQFCMYAGNPAKKIMNRNQNLLEIEKEFTNELKNITQNIRS
ncbi:acyltransferase [Macromonas nakdongensis]|uniref:acyltransferase n=1 Tax=Macromonas nakdongensis TaxID=1843082 RepID=UPI000C32350D|nr:acyltransferase [Macromonas nakdongensis]